MSSDVTAERKVQKNGYYSEEKANTNCNYAQW